MDSPEKESKGAETPSKASATAAQSSTPPKEAPKVSTEAVAALDGSQQSPAGKTSTVGKLLDSLAGDYKKSLLKYIASFGDGTNKFGSNPPCRSYRSLVLFSDFDDIEQKLKQCSCQADITIITKDNIVFKQALRDLMGMCKSAITRLESTIKSALTKNLSQEKQAAAEKPAKKKKLTADAQRASLVDFAHAECQDIKSVNLQEDGDPVTNDFDISVPLIFRLHPTWLQEAGKVVVECVQTFQGKFESDPRGSAGYAVYRVPPYHVSLGGVPRYRIIAYRVPRSGTSIYRVTAVSALHYDVPRYRINSSQRNQQECNFGWLAAWLIAYRFVRRCQYRAPRSKESPIPRTAFPGMSLPRTALIRYTVYRVPHQRWATADSLGDTARTDPGRAQRKCPAEVATPLEALAAKIHPSMLSKVSAPSLEQELVSSTFAVAKSRVTCCSETAHLATLRVSCTGVASPSLLQNSF